MAKLTKIYSCSNCGAQTPKWSGRCLDCGAWGTFQEEIIDAHEQKKSDLKISPTAVADLNNIEFKKLSRIQTGISEFDRVVGGGIIPGSLVLVGGEPGIGKSTLMLQIINSLDSLYISGEESAAQIKSRADRLGLTGKINFVAETNVEKIIASILEQKPQLAIIDSIQTIYSSDVPSESGSVNQIRACAVKLLKIAKEKNISIVITGHITKDGLLAGPKTLEHLVDAVIYLEQKNNDFRLLRTAKNRFGSTNEIGLFAMTAAGFQEIKNPSGIFLEQQKNVQTGNVVSCIMEGTRPFLVEVQALVTKTVFGYPQRKASGVDLNRLQILIAVLSKRANINLSNQDVHLNIVGGLKATETSLDLAICAAIISSLLNQVIDNKTIILSEVGLGGETRNISKLKERLQEAAKLGFTTALAPAEINGAGLKIIKINDIKQLTDYIVKK